MKDSILEITRELVALPTTPDHDEAAPRQLRRVAGFFRGSHWSATVTGRGRGATLLVKPRGMARPRFLLAGHLDVVPGDPGQFRLRQRGDRLYGRGAYDMKGPLAAMMAALMTAAASSPRGSFGLLVTVDEERGGASGTGAWVRRHRQGRPEVVFIPDGGEDFDLVIEEKGVLQVAVTWRGRPAHSSRPWEGDNPVAALRLGLERLERAFPPLRGLADWRTSAVVTGIRSGDANNRVPATAAVTLDIRRVAAQKPAAILKKLERCFGSGTVRVLNQAEALRVSPQAPPLVRYRRLYRELFGKETRLVRYPACCDARFFAAAGVPVIVARPRGGHAHGADEWVSLSGLEDFAALLVAYLTQP